MGTNNFKTDEELEEYIFNCIDDAKSQIYDEYESGLITASQASHKLKSVEQHIYDSL
jgi:hypothetical protein